MKGNKEKSYISYYIATVVAGFVIYKIWQLANRPDALKKTLEFLGTVALCFGAFVLFIAVLLIATSLANKIKKKPVRKTTDIQYELYDFRKKPDFDTREAYLSIVYGGVVGFIWLGVCYLVIVGFVSVLRGTRGARDMNWSSQICLGLCSLPAALFSIQVMMEGIVTLIQRRNWLRGTTKAQAAIIDGREIYTPYGNCYEFILQATDEQGVTALDGQFIRAGVSKRIYDRYAQYDSVEIYYSTDSPLTFMIRGE